MHELGKNPEVFRRINDYESHKYHIDKATVKVESSNVRNVVEKQHIEKKELEGNREELKKSLNKGSVQTGDRNLKI